MIEIEARMSELEELGLRRKTRLVSGPQGPRVVLDGMPSLVLCSSNFLGLADHPRVREAAAAAARRWGAGAGATRLASGTMTIHRRLEERLAAFLRRQGALLFGSGYLAGVGALAALARPGDVVFSDAHNHGSIVDGCRLSRAEVFVYDHLDVDHLRWGIAKSEGRGSLIVTESVFSTDGDVAPLREIVGLAQRRRLRTIVDEGQALGLMGPGGRGALAELGLEDQVDVILGTLGASLGSYGGFLACDVNLADYLLNASRTMHFSAALPPPAGAAALAALTLLEQRPELVNRLRSNGALLRRELERHGFAFERGHTPILSILIGDPGPVNEICEAARRRGVLTEAILPPIVPAAGARVRLAPSAAHRREELRDAARVVAEVVRAAGLEPAAAAHEPPSPAQLEDGFEGPLEAPIEPHFDVLPDEPGLGPLPSRIFDVEEIERLAA